MVGEQLLSLEETCDVFESVLVIDVMKLCCTRCTLIRSSFPNGQRRLNEQRTLLTVPNDVQQL
jgi:hypothetical protein